MQYAHEYGVIHRELKPSNVLVKQDASVRLVDFGIAKQLDPMGQDATHTRTALRQMTTAYASPEQLRGEPVNGTTDVYSLGIVLCQLLAERLPFDLIGKNAGEAERMISTVEPAKPSAVAPSPALGLRGRTLTHSASALWRRTRGLRVHPPARIGLRFAHRAPSGDPRH